MTSATEKLHAIIRRDIETGTKTYAFLHGHDWFNLTRAEEEVFGLSLDDMPSLIAVWCAYEAVLGICDAISVPADIVADIRADHPWLADRHGGVSGCASISAEDFQQFARLFGVPFRKSHAWYVKHEFWTIRSGITTYTDEVRPVTAAVVPLDDDIPF